MRQSQLRHLQITPQCIWRISFQTRFHLAQAALYPLQWVSSTIITNNLQQWCPHLHHPPSTFDLIFRRSNVDHLSKRTAVRRWNSMHRSTRVCESVSMFCNAPKWNMIRHDSLRASDLTINVTKKRLWQPRSEDDIAHVNLRKFN